MADDSVVEQIVKSLSFEVEAVPQEKDVQAASTSNMTPLNIKIRVRKKDKSDIERGLLSVPKFGNPTSAPERIRLISSDQTIMSFNVLMEADLVKKAKRKPRKNFFGGCLGTQYDDDDGPYVPSSTYSAKVTDTSISSKSEGVIKQNFTLLKNQNDNTNDLDLPFNKKTGILGKCKRGGCLDPPFGEDNYTYKPVLRDDHLVTSISENKVQKKAQTEKHDDKKQDNIMILKSSKHNVSKQKAKEGVHDDSILSIFEADRLKDSLDTKYSDSIITYPPEASSSTNFNEKYLRNRISSEETQRKSMNEGSESFFSPSRKGNRRKESKEHKKVYASSTDGHTEKPEAGLVRQKENVDDNLERLKKATPQHVAAATLISLGAATIAVAKSTNIDKDAISLLSKTDLKSKSKEPIDSDYNTSEKPHLDEIKSDDVKSPQAINYENIKLQEKNDMKRLPLKYAPNDVNSDAGSFGNIDPGKKSYNNNPPDMSIDDQDQKYKKTTGNLDTERQPLRHAFIDDTSDAGSYGNIDPGKKIYNNNPPDMSIDDQGQKYKKTTGNLNTERQPLRHAFIDDTSDAGSNGNIDPGKKSYNNNPPDMSIDDQGQKYIKTTGNADTERQPLRHAFTDATSDAGSYGNIDPGKKSYNNNPSNMNDHMNEKFLEKPEFIPISEQFKDGISRPFDMEKDIKDKYGDANSINSTMEKPLNRNIINQSDMKEKYPSETYNTEKTEVIYKKIIEKTKVTRVPSKTISTLSSKEDKNSIIESSRGTVDDESRTHKTESDKTSQISTDRIHNKRSDLLQKDAENGSTIASSLENNLKKNTDEVISLHQQPLHISTYEDIMFNNTRSSYDNQKTSDEKNHTNVDLQNNKQNPSETEGTFENYDKDTELVNIKEGKENAFQSNEQKDVLDKESKDFPSKKVVEGYIEGYPEPTFKVNEHKVIDDELQEALNKEFENDNLFTNDVALLTTEKESLKINIEKATTSFQKYLNTSINSKDSNDNIHTKATAPSTKQPRDVSDSTGLNREDVYSSHSDALLVGKTEKSVSPNDFNSAHSASLLRTPLKSLNEDRSITTVEIATTNLTSSRSSIIKDKIKDNITLELGFQSYLNDKNERVLKTIDTSKELVHQSNETVTIIKSQIRPQLKDNIRVPVDSKNELSIQIKRTDSPVRFQLQDNDKLDHKPSHITDHTNILNMEDKSCYEAKSYGKITGVEMQRILNSMYEHDLIPLQKSINYLKQDIELLSLQQNVYNKDKANSSKRSKPIRIYKVNQKCDCWKK